MTTITFTARYTHELLTRFVAFVCRVYVPNVPSGEKGALDMATIRISSRFARYG